MVGWAQGRMTFPAPRPLHSTTPTIPTSVLGPDFVVIRRIGAYGAATWPVIPWAQPASVKRTKSAASQLCRSISSVRLPDPASLGRTRQRRCRASTLTKTTTHSMTSSARARIKGGIVKPSAFAVFKLTMKSNLTGS
jgi:hypothetical protein